jgi:hypothetical protein
MKVQIVKWFDGDFSWKVLLGGTLVVSNDLYSTRYNCKRGFVRWLNRVYWQIIWTADVKEKIEWEDI